MAFVYDYIGAHDQETYDLENQIADPNRRIERFIETLAPIRGATIADIGAGGGYHACRFAETAAAVLAVEPAPRMLALLYGRLANERCANVSVLAMNAEQLPLRDAIVDLVHSRFAYFFGPERPATGARSCLPGIREALRILRPGGYFFIIDNCLVSGDFARILAQHGYSRGRPDEMQRENDAFYAGQAFSNTTVDSEWRAPDRESLRRVMAMEFGAEAAETIMASVDGARLSYHYRIYYRRRE